MITLLWALATFLCWPFLALAAANRKTNNAVLVLSLGKIGDVVASTPIFRALKQDDPTRKIHVICLASSAVGLRHNPFIDVLHEIDSRTNRWTLLRNLRSERFRVVISALPTSFGNVAGLWLLAPIRVISTSTIHGMLMAVTSVFGTHRVRYALGINTFTHYMALLASMNVKPIPYQLDFAFTPEHDSDMVEWMEIERLEPKKFVIINISAGNGVKQWPLEKFASVARYCIDEWDAKVVISTADMDLARKFFLMISRTGMVVDGSGLSLQHLGALSKRALAFVSVDTGPMYVAFASGCPVVIIAGPVDLSEQAPPVGPTVAHVLPPEGTKPWLFVAKTERHPNPFQRLASTETTIDAVTEGLRKVTNLP